VEVVKRIWRLLSCVRYREVLVLQGAPVMGGVLAMGKPTMHKAALGAVFAVANFCLVAHMWSLNDWADRHADLADDSKSLHVFTRKGIDPATMLGLSLGLLSAALALFAWLTAATFWIALGLSLLSLLYSFPGLHAKGVALLSSLPHLAGGFLHFLLGYSLFAAVGPNALRIAVVFALVFTAGHGVQEVQDHDADRRAGIRTNAVVFGKSAVFGVSLVAFLFVYAYLSHLAAAGIVLPRLGLPSLALAALHLYWAREALRAGLSLESVRRYRGRYRALFALLGLTVISRLFS
jgi:4-hydroxybenzoate polyprenyltransferase